MIDARVTYVIVPGWNGSPDGHWQSHWQRVLPNAVRVEQQNWHQPRLEHWVATLEHTLRGLRGPLVLVAHSLGCVTVAHWARQAAAADLDRVAGALLVAPADVERAGCPQELVNFAPVPTTPLPFPAVLVGSSNDHAASAARALEMAAHWDCEATILQQAGHINIASGHSCWEQGLAYLYQLQEKMFAATGQRCA